MSFDLTRATISSLSSALSGGEISCVDVIEQCLARIDAYDASGPALNSILSVNPRALDLAADLDRLRSKAPGAIGALHGVPIVIKDNIATAEMPTSGGSLALGMARAAKDATAVARLRAAGAIVLAKTNLHELALGGTSVSSLGGQTRNPYDLSRTPGGSSGGTGAAVAAGYAVVGLGTDTGQSVRSPASALNLVGLRPTQGSISCSGVVPTSTTQDTVGPITRNAEDAARVFDVLAGFDPADVLTGACHGKALGSFAQGLRRDALRGTRIGVLGAMFGESSRHEEVNRTVRSSFEGLQALGATLVNIAIPDLDDLVFEQQTFIYEMKEAFDKYVGEFLTDPGVRCLEDLVSDGRFHGSIADALQRILTSGGTANPAYARIFVRRGRLCKAVLYAMAIHRLDVILYPHQRVLVAKLGEGQLERNGVLSNATGFPAIALPAGFSSPDEHAPLGVPIGMELLGPKFSEGKLLSYAYAFEQLAGPKLSPYSTPPL